MNRLAPSLIAQDISPGRLSRPRPVYTAVACGEDQAQVHQLGLYDRRIRPYSAFMPDTLPPCPNCRSSYTYEMDALLTCPECGHEWTPDAVFETAVRDSVGNILADGDTVTVIKDLKLKGTSSVIKVGTKVRGIRLVVGDHDIDCKVPGVGPIGLKSQFVKKVAG